MDNASLVRIQSRFLILGGIVLFTNVFLTLFLCARRVQMKKDIQIDQGRFYEAVQLGTSNFLSSVQSKHSEDLEQSHKIERNVKVVYVPVLSTWYSPRSGLSCQIEDCVYRVGDYCEHGVIVSIADARVYVDSGDGIVIIRRRSPSAGADAARDESRRAAGGEMAASDN